MTKDQQRQRQTEVEHQQSREQAELDERQRVERDEIWQLYKLRKQQEQQLVEERQWRYQLQQQQQATLSDKFQQHVSETLLQYEPPSRKAPEPMEPGPSLVQESNKAPQFIQTFVSSTPQSWSQALTADHVESQVADEDEDDEASDREGHPRQYYNSQHTQSQQYDWRELRRISKVYTPMPRRKRGRKGRGDLFEDDYHAGFNKIEIQSLSTAGKAAYESQRQRRQQHDAPALDLE
ncbi:hypothetical protein BGZ95_000227 [Linnemannia exigua]|uniref:Uncharacterized protein n=1 Tax=Linnemannia exigua TaxID=604196 RepID=A0AAD4DAA1_9FUNG|nr:hypothetical protein BGZ95_000227 [Linnemannia exigua]